MPDAGLGSYLDRGPTPQRASFKVSRVPVTIAAVTAGANQADAAMSFDDNEMTSWANDGKLATGRIQYIFDRPSKVSQVVMKLAKWRTRRYPIRILVDDKEAFKGETQQNLGYYTVRFPLMYGQSLTVELIGAGTDKDAFDIVEVTGKRDAAGQSSTDPNAKGTLEIVELEIYYQND